MTWDVDDNITYQVRNVVFNQSKMNQLAHPVLGNWLFRVGLTSLSYATLLQPELLFSFFIRVVIHLAKHIPHDIPFFNRLGPVLTPRISGRSIHICQF